jgi:hypothetical protein
VDLLNFLALVPETTPQISLPSFAKGRNSRKYCMTVKVQMKPLRKDKWPPRSKFVSIFGIADPDPCKLFVKDLKKYFEKINIL